MAVSHCYGTTTPDHKGTSEAWVSLASALTAIEHCAKPADLHQTYVNKYNNIADYVYEGTSSKRYKGRLKKLEEFRKHLLLFTSGIM